VSSARRRAARWGDGWIGYLLSVDSFARRRALLTQSRSELELDAAGFATGMLLPVYIDRRGGDAHARAGAAWGKLVAVETALPSHLFVAGSADEVVEQLHAYWQAGCTEVMLAPADQGDGYFEQLDRLAGDVLPALRTFH
jgi:alkanesulfonate monooxygenase SsuD/methylene tetrahydromethanopterin reductase-like flavin-dependent oxidoreductase (luciferase family)